MTHAPAVHGPTEVIVEPDLPYPGPASPCSEPPRRRGEYLRGRVATAVNLDTEVDDANKAAKKDTDEG